jgi:hypothetical protein
VERLDQGSAPDDGWVERCETIGAKDDKQAAAERTGVINPLDHRVDADPILVVRPLEAAVKRERVASSTTSATNRFLPASSTASSKALATRLLISPT